MPEAIFNSTSQALHFAYIIQAYEASVESVMAKALRRLIKMHDVWNHAPSTVNFGGLNALEVRAQCAMIRAAVRDRLPGPEAWAIEARHGINIITMKDGRRLCAFSRDRHEAILKLGNYLAPSFPHFNPLAVNLLVARVVDKQCQHATLRRLASGSGLGHSAFFYALARVRDRIYALEGMAIDRLTPVFTASGLVES
ncbi:MAG: hypothetical protein LBF93_10620 [Zoogloeaceae bacterium]|jgi:hypothetical protein|nr:hypothetical protein [Zoogloeaceae bacterium]